MSLDPLYRAVGWLLIQIHAGLTFIGIPGDSGLAWGGAIIVLTVMFRLLLFPLFVKQIHASRKMQELNPQIQALRKKYKNDKQRLNQETMKLYQENGANPLAGCLPLVVQMPVFLGLFGVLRGLSNAMPGTGSHGISPALVASAHHADIFGAHISDTFLKSWGHGFTSALVLTGIAVIISSTTTFLTVRSSMKRQPAMDDSNPMASAQKMMVFVAPLFGLFGVNFPLGVLMYWVTTNSWTLVQQHYIYKRYPTPALAGAGGDTAPAAKTPSKTPAKPGSKPVAKRSSSMTSADRPARMKKKPAEAAVEPEVEAKVVRKQPVKQPRSKRTGAPKR
ncbi:MAG TPA: membrane protein insertase YidC [Streptosporangiaceae bacterium]|nr:membrane protein insertase YidC [Streptosporangiaceae bacterium]